MAPWAELSVGHEAIMLPGVTRSWGVGAPVAYSKDQSLFFAWQEKDSTDAVLIQRLWTGEQIRIPLNPQPKTRPMLFASPAGLLLVAGEDLDQSHLPYVFYIHGYEWPGGDVTDPRVDSVISVLNAIQTEQDNQRARLNAMQQKLVEIETALGNVSGDTLRELLRAWLGIP